jgi:uncharacterized protein YjiS (DUF1127 family)
MLRTAHIPIGGGRSESARRLLTPEWWRTCMGSLALLVSLWLERTRTRRVLAELDEHLLRDIGRTSIEAQRESARPFWKPWRRPLR